jgi:hypothetical protein
MGRKKERKKQMVMAADEGPFLSTWNSWTNMDGVER